MSCVSWLGGQLFATYGYKEMQHAGYIWTEEQLIKRLKNMWRLRLRALIGLKNQSLAGCCVVTGGSKLLVSDVE